MTSRPTAPTRVALVLGTRPEAIKLAPLALALAASPRHDPVVISTGQHRDLVTPLLAGFGLRADVDLGLMVAGQRLAEFAGRAMVELARSLDEVAAEVVVVQGDTSTTLAGALAGFYGGLRVVHLEAGLRTGDRFSPFPEEANRRMVTQCADLHLAPTDRSRAALLAEGVPSAAIAMVGNTVVDALLETVRRDEPYRGPAAAQLQRLHEVAGRLMLVTAHRREAWGEGIASIARAVARSVMRHPDLHVVFPVHPNPVVREVVRAEFAALLASGDAGRVLLTDPLDYADLVRVLARCDVVVTDSGGLQEEACSLGKPTLVTRDTTERPEGKSAGGLLLVGTDQRRIEDAVTRLLTDAAAYEALVCRTMPFGDGQAARRCVEAIDAALGRSMRPATAVRA